MYFRPEISKPTALLCLTAFMLQWRELYTSQPKLMFYIRISVTRFSLFKNVCLRDEFSVDRSLTCQAHRNSVCVYYWPIDLND